MSTRTRLTCLIILHLFNQVGLVVGLGRQVELTRASGCLLTSPAVQRKISLCEGMKVGLAEICLHLLCAPHSPFSD